jgi:hypothetical protein
MASSNMEQLFGLERDGDVVATMGGDLLSFDSKVVGVISERRGMVDLF